MCSSCVAEQLSEVVDQSPCSDEREKTSVDVECTHVRSKLVAAPSARGEYEGGSDGMTMDGITTSFSLFFCNDLVFFLATLCGWGWRWEWEWEWGEVKQLVTWLMKLVGWCACLLGAGKEPNQQGKSFFFFLYFF